MLIGRDKTGTGYGSVRRRKGNHKASYSLDPSSPFRPITLQEGRLFPQQQIGSPVKPIPIQGGALTAAPRRFHWTEDNDDGGFGTPGRAKRSLFSGKDEESSGQGRGRSRGREYRNKGDTEVRAKSLNSRQVTRTMPPGAQDRRRPTSLDRSLMALQRHSFHEVPDLTRFRSGENVGEFGAFRAVDPQPRSPEKSFYDHQPHKFWSPYRKGEQHLRRERAKTIAVPSFLDYAKSYVPTMADTRRVKTTGDLSQSSDFDTRSARYPFMNKVSSRGTYNALAQDDGNVKTKYSPAILRRKPRNPSRDIRRERPKSMPNVTLDSLLFGTEDENNNLQRMKTNYDFADTPLVRPQKEFNLVSKTQGRNTNARNLMSPRPNKKGVGGRGL